MYWALRETHARFLAFPEIRPPNEFAQLIPWLKKSPLTTPLEEHLPSSGSSWLHHKRSVTCCYRSLFSSPKVLRRSSLRASLDQRVQQPLNTPITINADTNSTEHDPTPSTVSIEAEIPHFRESQSTVDINVIDNRLEVQAYNQGLSPPSPVIATKIDHSIANLQPLFDRSFYPPPYPDFVPSNTGHFDRSLYPVPAMQHDSWNEGNNTGNMIDHDQMIDQEILFTSPSQYYPPTNNRYNFSYDHQQ